MLPRVQTMDKIAQIVTKKVGGTWRLAVRPKPVAFGIIAVAAYHTVFLAIAWCWFAFFVDWTKTGNGTLSVLPWMIPSFGVTFVLWTHCFPLDYTGTIQSNSIGILGTVIAFFAILVQVVFLWTGIFGNYTPPPIDTPMMELQKTDYGAPYIVAAVMGVPLMLIADVLACVMFILNLISLLWTGAATSVPILGPFISKFASKVI